MFLTKVFLNADDCRRERLSDDYSLHRLVYSFFPRGAEARRLLYADRGPVDGGRGLLILSPDEPQLPAEISASSVLVSDAFFQAKTYRFEVILNPVRKDPGTGKRCAVIGQLPLLNWFVARAEKWGFTADQQTLEAQTRPSKVFPKDGGECRFHQVLFHGTLQVADAALFRRSMESGLGHGKAFGFGLLQLQPVFHAHNTNE